MHIIIKQFIYNKEYVSIIWAESSIKCVSKWSENGKMGKMVDSMKPSAFTDAIEPLLTNATLVKQMSQYNYQYAQKHFLASRIALNMENKLKTVLNFKG